MIRSFLWWLTGAVIAAVAVFVTVLAFVISQFDGTARVPAQCVVVFGAAVHQLPGSGAILSLPGPAILRRVGTAADMYADGLVERLFLTGGRGEGMLRSEAEVMRDVAITRGVDAGAIVLEDRARSTTENIRFTMPLTASCATVMGVSDRYHLARIRFLAWRAGWTLSTFPATTPIQRAFEAQSILREVLAILYQGVTGR